MFQYYYFFSIVYVSVLVVVYLNECISLAYGEDVTLACGSDQLCDGIKSGIEGAMHYICRHFLMNSQTLKKIGE